MRMYDVLTGKRFDAGTELWQTHMLNKDGSIKKRMDYKLAAKLEADGIIELVPSVTEVAKVADGFGAFGSGAKWGRDMTVEAYSDWLVHANEAEALSPEALEERAKAIMDAPREAGGELHDLFHRVRTGEKKDAALTDDERKFYMACTSALSQLGINDGYETEVEFADRELCFGGTCDLNARKRGLDWKTVKAKRPPRNSEILQVAAYSRHFGWERADIVYISQSTLSVVRIETLDAAALERGWDAFRACLGLMGKLKAIG